MAWIESHQELGHHPKTIMFADLLHVNLPTAVGHLHYFWWWALDFAPSGEIRTTPTVVARACEWRGNAERFRDALIDSGFIERKGEALQIHDWLDYAGRFEAKRAANRDRQRRFRNAHITRDTTQSVTQEVTGITRDERVSNGATVPNLTVPNRTVHLPQTPSEPSEGADAPPDGAKDETPKLERPPRPVEQRELSEPACCPNFARTGEHWQLCPRASS